MQFKVMKGHGASVLRFVIMMKAGSTMLTDGRCLISMEINLDYEYWHTHMIMNNLSNAAYAM
jgi:hypothetical protein